MDTSNLMSSLREMVKAETMVTLFDSGAVAASQETKDQWRLQYTRHETVVREGLQMLANEACKTDHARAAEGAEKRRNEMMDEACRLGRERIEQIGETIEQLKPNT